uniref:Dihydroxy-acid dehydratase n=1 Tax=Ascaris lumbricoides TaxID=6252 RepID=A0A0M3HET4_ASCLU
MQQHTPMNTIPQYKTEISRLKSHTDVPLLSKIQGSSAANFVLHINALRWFHAPPMDSGFCSPKFWTSCQTPGNIQTSRM